MGNNTNHIERYQLGKLSDLLDSFECLMDDTVTGKMKSNEDYPNILLQAAGKSSLTLRAMIHLCTCGFPDTALILARQLYEQSILLCFFEQKKQQSNFQDYVEDYYADYDLQIAQYNKWQAEKIAKDQNKVSQCQQQIDAIRKKAHNKNKGTYWWTGQGSFRGIVDYLIDSVNSQYANHMVITHLLYLRACKEAHAGALGNALRLGSDPDICGVDNSAKTSGHGLPLYFAVSSFNLIVYIVFGNLGIEGEKLIKECDELMDFYAAVDHEEAKGS